MECSITANTKIDEIKVLQKHDEAFITSKTIDYIVKNNP